MMDYSTFPLRLSACLSVCMYVCLYLSAYICLSVCLYLSTYLPTCLSPRLSISVSYVSRSWTVGGNIPCISRKLDVVNDSEIPAMAEFFVSNFWEEDIGPSQVFCRRKIPPIRQEELGLTEGRPSLAHSSCVGEQQGHGGEMVECTIGRQTVTEKVETVRPFFIEALKKTFFVLVV